MGITVSDLPITGPHCIYSVTIGQYIWQWLDRSAPGDLPPDVASLPVVGLRSVRSDTCDVLYIDVVT